MADQSNVKYSGLRTTIKDKQTKARRSSSAASRTSSLSNVSTSAQSSRTKVSSTSKKRRRSKNKCHYIDCDDCAHPCGTRKETKADKKPKCQSLARINSKDFRIRTDFVIASLGSVPVIKGDPKFLPERVQKFVAEKARLMCPSAIYICNGSVFEQQEMLEILQKQGIVEQLQGHTEVYLTRTDPQDTVRVEKATWICHKNKEVVEGRRNSTTPCEFARHMPMRTLRTELDSRFPGCMRGRIMYVIPFSMGPIAGKFSKCAVQLTDSPYVIVNMRVMTRVSSAIWDSIGSSDDFVRCIHSVGLPRPVNKKLHLNWPCNAERLLVAHCLEELEVWSFGSGFGGNSLLGKKALALRMASFVGRREGWLAEHAAILSITNPAGEEKFICVGFPSDGGKTALALSHPAIEGWKIKVLGDDIAWIRMGEDGQMFAMNPENGMFGIASGITDKTSQIALKMLSKNTLLANVASTSRGRMFWQGLEDSLLPDETVTDWRGQTWTKKSESLPAHPNARFTVSMNQCPTAHDLWDSPKGVPISAYIWGSKRPDAFPLVLEAENWEHGVTIAASIRCTAGRASDKKTDGLVHDPMGMRAFMAYGLGEYVKHWMIFGSKLKQQPKLFHVNWYRKGSDGKLLWPGFGQNIRVLEWILGRCAGKETDNADKVPGGFVPQKLNMEGLEIDPKPALNYDKEFWKNEVSHMKQFFDAELGTSMPEEVQQSVEKLEHELNA